MLSFRSRHALTSEVLTLVVTVVALAACSAPPAACTPTDAARTPRATAADDPRVAVVQVPAKPLYWPLDVFTPTAVQIKTGDTITFAATGAWDVGKGRQGPDGKGDWCARAVAEQRGSGQWAPVGALVGRIWKEGKPFLIGSASTLAAPEDALSSCRQTTTSVPATVSRRDPATRTTVEASRSASR
jgi:plastocyanin